MKNKIICAAAFALPSSVSAQEIDTQPIVVTGRAIPPIVVTGSAIDRSLLSPMGLAIVREGSGQARTASTAFLISNCYALTTRSAFGNDREVVGRYVEYWSGVRGDVRSWKGYFAQVAAAGSQDTSDQASAGNDWILLRIKSCPGKKLGTMTLDTSPPEVNRRYILAGFPANKRYAEGVFVDPDCRMSQLKGSFASYKCAIQPGESGSPIIRVDNDHGHKRVIVVAIMTGNSSQSAERANRQKPQIATQFPDRAILASAIVRSRQLNEVIMRDEPIKMPLYPGNVTFEN